MKIRDVIAWALMIGGAAFIMLSLIGCSSPVGPSVPEVERWRVLLKVKEQKGEQPIPGAAIWQDSAYRGVTDGRGELELSAEPGRELCFSASKAGYLPSVVACGELTNTRESWTFYLEK